MWYTALVHRLLSYGRPHTNSCQRRSRAPQQPHGLAPPLTPSPLTPRSRHAPPAEKLIVALSLASAAAMQTKALAVRGGAAVGPIDEALAMNTVCTSVVYHLQLFEA